MGAIFQQNHTAGEGHIFDVDASFANVPPLTITTISPLSGIVFLLLLLFFVVTGRRCHFVVVVVVRLSSVIRPDQAFC